MEELDILLRLLMAAACGGVLGVERERGDRPAGFKTYILVTMGACLFTILSIIAFPEDQARVAAQVVVGIGFLGAGVIVIYGGTRVVGITTVATLWATAALGMSAGLGYYLTCAYSTAIMLAVLVAIPWMEEGLIGKFRKRRLYFTMRGRRRTDILQEVEEVLGRYGSGFMLLRYYVCGENGGETSLLVRSTIPGKVDLLEVLDNLFAIQGVTTVDFED